MHCAKKCGLFLLAMLLAAAICTGAGLFYAADWLSAADQPQKADAILVLGGSYTRPFEASDLYHRGFAPRIYFGAPVRERQYRLLDEAGIPYPRRKTSCAKCC